MASAELQKLLQMMKARPAPERPPTLPEMRAGFDAMAIAVPADVTVTPVDAGGVKAEWIHTPGADGNAAILYLHGGGYVIGSPTSHRDLAQRLSRAAGVRVLLLDYRLAPEHPFPAALDDAVAAYRWLLKQGVDAQRVVIAGDSAGGGLTLATLIALRDAGDALPPGAVAISPWSDLALTGESMTTRRDRDPIITDSMEIGDMAAQYIGGKDAKNPLISPLYASYAGLPPLLIQVGECEVLYDDAGRVAEKAKAAGVDVTFEPWPDMIHVWHLFAGMLPEGQQAIEGVGQFVRQRMGAVAAR